MQHTELDQKSLKRLGMHFCQVKMLSLPFIKKVKCQHWQFSPKVILYIFGEINASESDLMKVERDYISAWYGQTKGISLTEAR